jgi:hypothetical protein
LTVFSALSNPGLRALWGGFAALAVSQELFRIAALWLAAANAPEAAPWVTATQSAVSFAAVLGGVAIGGGWSLRRILVAAAAAEAVATLSLLLAAGGDGPPALAPILLAVAAATFAHAQMEPSLQAALPRIARDGTELLRGNGLLDGTRRIARLVGPGLSAALLLALPVAGLVPVAGALCALAALAFLRLPPLGEDAGGGVARGWSALAEALRLIVGDPGLRVQMVLSIAMNVVWVAGPVLGWTLLLEDRFGAEDGAARYGALIAAYAVSNIAVNLWAASRRAAPSLRAAVAAQGLFGVGIAAVGLGGLLGLPWPALLAGAAVAGAGPPMFDLRLAWTLQTSLPRPLVGPGFRLRIAWAWGAMLLGSGISGLAPALPDPALLPLAAGGAAVAISAAALAVVLRLRIAEGGG